MYYLVRKYVGSSNGLAHLVFRKSEGLPTSGSSVDLAELASLPLVIKEKDVEYQVFNLNKPNGLSHPYKMGESILIFGGIGSNFSFFDEKHVSKQHSPR